MKLKICKDCKIEKPIDQFYRKRNNCKPCRKIILNIWKKQNPDLVKASKKQSYLNNKEQIAIKDAIYYAANIEYIKEREHRRYLANKESISAQKKAYRKEFPWKANALSAKRHAAKMQRVPKWLTKGDWIEIEWAYSYAKQLTKETGVKHVVDHIIPLQGKNISGLHCPQNLQVIPNIDNIRKHNHFLPELLKVK